MTTILYAEDHPPAQLLMEAIIADLTPYRLICARTGEEAVAMMQQHHPDVYLLDLDLPDTDGVALAQRLNSVRAAPTILVSAYAEAMQPDSAYPYLAKPLDPEDVAQVLRRALTGH